MVPEGSCAKIQRETAAGGSTAGRYSNELLKERKRKELETVGGELSRASVAIGEEQSNNVESGAI